MRVVKNQHFDESLKDILRFIAEDSKPRAKEFKNILFEKLENLTFMPLKYRKSIYFDDENIRDLVYLGYVVPYKIEKDKIVIIGITKYRIGL